MVIIIINGRSDSQDIFTHEFESGYAQVDISVYNNKKIIHTIGFSLFALPCKRQV